MPKAKDQDKRIHILRTAKKIFGKAGEGPETSVKEVARLTEMSPSSLYTYFPSKESMIQEVIERDWAWMRREIGEGSGGAEDPEEARAQAFKAFSSAVMPELLADDHLASLIVRYPQAIAGLGGKMEEFRRILDPALKAARERAGEAPLDEEARRAQCAIMVLGALCAVHFSANSELRFGIKDILNGFRGFIA